VQTGFKRNEVIKKGSRAPIINMVRSRYWCKEYARVTEAGKRNGEGDTKKPTMGWFPLLGPEHGGMGKKVAE